MSPASLNAVHVIAEYAAYIGAIALLSEGYVDFIAWRARRAARIKRQKALRVVKRLEPLDPQIMRKLHANSAYAHRRMGRRAYR